MFKISIIEEKKECKLEEFPHMPFIVIHTDGSRYLITENKYDDKMIMTDINDGYSYDSINKIQLLEYINDKTYKIVKSELKIYL